MLPRWFAGFAAACLLICQQGLYGQGAPAPKKGAGPARTFTAATEKQADATINLAGSFLNGKLNSLTEGYSNIVAVALLKSGHKPEEPAIRGALDRILALIKGGTYTPLNSHLHIYEAGTAIMALGSADAKKYKPQMEAIAQYIISQQGNQGHWEYDTGHLNGTGDTSISQYAILGLWEASRAGITVPGQVWDKAAAWHVKSQVGDGGFCYHPNDFSPGTHPDHRRSSHAMTLAGICNLQIARLHLYPNARDLEAELQKKLSRGVKWGVLEPLQIEEDDPDAGGGNLSRQDSYKPTVRLAAIDTAVKNGVRWISQRFSITPDSGWQIYFLYTLERMATLTGLDEIGGHDWYSEGTAYLVANQNSDGNWTDGCNDAAAALAALFLGRATIKMLKHKPRPRFGTGILKGGRDLPENLDNLTADKGDLKVKKMTGSIDAMLVELEKLDSINLESAQAALEDLSILKDASALLKQRDRLLKLAKDPRPNARSSAFSVLGKTDDIRVAPVLIDAVANDKDPDCVIAAHKSLKLLSRLVRLGDTSDKLEFTEDAPPTRRDEIVKFWRNWYRVSRPYAERDGLPASP